LLSMVDVYVVDDTVIERKKMDGASRGDDDGH
jgi:hypothetical protein